MLFKVTPMINKLHSDGVQKQYLTDAPYIVVLMKEAWQVGVTRHADYPRRAGRTRNHSRAARPCSI